MAAVILYDQHRCAAGVVRITQHMRHCSLDTLVFASRSAYRLVNASVALSVASTRSQNGYHFSDTELAPFLKRNENMHIHGRPRLIIIAASSRAEQRCQPKAADMKPRQPNATESNPKQHKAIQSNQT